ncbi:MULTISPECIES: COP23 domain-containing protein [unclassified Synechococcus]|uniref:COP23 domain-containing protein n=1 Tax=unclassified Synechococcus TaxID=2626047 RepID=UPI0020CB7AAE|nr:MULTISPECIES: COP23 domain-containing protein [unclassified Synechococcus]
MSARNFVCGTAAGAPSTNVVTADGRQVPVIRWTSSVFNDAGWNQQLRCQEVSARFDTYLKQGRLAFITTGRMNGLPVICTAPSKGGACDGLLYTLKPGQAATSTLKNLLEIRVKARGPLNETNGRLYVSLDELLSTAQANATNMASPASVLPQNRLF